MYGLGILFDWGDGSVDNGGFVAWHTYRDPSKSYIINVSARNPEGDSWQASKVAEFDQSNSGLDMVDPWVSRTEASQTVTVNSNTVMTATFVQVPTHTLTVQAGVGGTVTPTAVTSTVDGTAIPITATPDAGYSFSGWTIISGNVYLYDSNRNNGADTGADATALLWGEDTVIEANFTAPGGASLTISANAGGTAGVVDASGTITPAKSSPTTFSYPSGTEVFIAATPLTGYVFNGWTVVNDGIIPGEGLDPASMVVNVISYNGNTVTVNGAFGGSSPLWFQGYFFDWGDGNFTNEWFTASHTYGDTSKNYVITVGAYDESENLYQAQILAEFNPSNQDIATADTWICRLDTYQAVIVNRPIILTANFLPWQQGQPAVTVEDHTISLTVTPPADPVPVGAQYTVGLQYEHSTVTVDQDVGFIQSVILLDKLGH